MSKGRNKPYSLKYVKRKFCSMGWRLYHQHGEYLHLYADKHSLQDNKTNPHYMAGGIVLTIQEKRFQVVLKIRGYRQGNLHLNLYLYLDRQEFFTRINNDALALINLSDQARDIMEQSAKEIVQ
jgi:hypothetical protein